MNRPVLAICDTESRYCGRLDEYLRKNLNLSFDIHSFTKVKSLEEFAGKNLISLLVIAESAVAELKKKACESGVKNILILDEELSIVREDEEAFEEDAALGVNSEHISKFSPASEIVYHILDLCAKSPEDFESVGVRRSDGKGTVIGLYSPIARCGQTALSVKLCEELSKHGKTMLLNFDNFSPLPMIFGTETEGDITDLLYYSECEKSRFCIYLEKIKQSIGGFDYIPPAATAMQIKEIDYERLKNLIELIFKECGYEYMVLDLSDLPGGLYDILRYCNKVITIMGKTKADGYKLRKYEEVLSQNGYEDVCAAGVKITIPEGAGDRELAACARDLLYTEGITGGEKI
ncbi:hypothetical protein D6853_12185 [Butyrivibrio sp. X503]|uniref:hypothetical protein n=1 Tax=Butyrivibrio sp. X503 TaxID=2364878 RepID=UPI000EAA0D7B|nr:hypothetical protein [Butyrivibrio sp. X503]RKM54984.1 hypothetical protein D6853_12185 [Butyrivibrio sp. X503]